MNKVASKYSEKLIRVGANPRYRGAYFPEDAAERGLAFVEAKEGDIKLFLLVEPNKDIISGAKYFTYGGSFHIAIGDTLCSMLDSKSMDDLALVTGNDVDKALRDEGDTPSAPSARMDQFAMVDKLLTMATDEYIAAKVVALATLSLKKNGSTAPVYEGSQGEMETEWKALSKREKIVKIYEVVEKDIRPFLNYDGGDLEVVDIVNGHEIVVEFNGSCESCASSTTSTLYSIEDILRKKLFNGIKVSPIGFM